MTPRALLQDYFLIGISCICCFYLGFEFFFNTYAMISVDEFWFAHSIYKFKTSLPYRDFAPYKTVLGYYTLLMPMLLSHGTIKSLIFTKNAIALLNTIILFGSSCWLSKFFSRASILASLAILIFSETALFYSSNLRVDLLSYWFCFFSLLFLLENRFIFAGLLIGLGFITSPKAIWYIFASNGALAIYCLVYKRNLKALVNIIRFNFASLCTLAAYIIFWSWIADWNTVINSVFREAAAMYQLDWYDSSRKLFWSLIVLFNPLLFLLWPLTLISLFVTYEHDRNYQRRFFIVCYSFIILLCLLSYQQVFPYYMQVTLPIFIVLYTAFFSWLFDIFTGHPAVKIIVTNKGLWLGLLFYISAIICTFIKLKLPEAYLLICLIPLLLGTYLIHHATIHEQLCSLFFTLIIITMIFIGGIYPLMLFIIKVINVDGCYQKANIQAINRLLKDGSDYVAGIELIYNKSQPIAGLRHLMGPAIDFLTSPNEKLRSVMLASLYEDPTATTASVIAALKKSPIKFYVNNYRMMALPENIQTYLHSEYEHFWGSIYLYAPQIHAGKHDIMLKFSGKYSIESPSSNRVMLNGKTHTINSTFYLEQGQYTSVAKKKYRLKLNPDYDYVTQFLDLKYEEDDWQKIIF